MTSSHAISVEDRGELLVELSWEEVIITFIPNLVLVAKEREKLLVKNVIYAIRKRLFLE